MIPPGSIDSALSAGTMLVIDAGPGSGPVTSRFSSEATTFGGAFDGVLTAAAGSAPTGGCRILTTSVSGSGWLA